MLSRFEKDALVNNSQTEYFKTLTELAEIEAFFLRAEALCDDGAGDTDSIFQ